jgi:hypothetical protein
VEAGATLVTKGPFLSPDNNHQTKLRVDYAVE